MLPKEAREEERAIRNSIRFMDDMKKFNEYRLAQLYKKHSPQLELFPGLFP